MSYCRVRAIQSGCIHFNEYIIPTKAKSLLFDFSEHQIPGFVLFGASFSCRATTLYELPTTLH